MEENNNITKRKRGTKYAYFSCLGFLIASILIVIFYFIVSDFNAFSAKFTFLSLFISFGPGTSALLFLIIRLFTCFIRKETKVYRLNIISMILEIIPFLYFMSFMLIFLATMECYGGRSCSGNVCECTGNIGTGFLDLYNDYNDYVVTINLILFTTSFLNYIVMFILMICKTKHIRVTIKENKIKEKEEKIRLKNEKQEELKRKEEAKRLEEERIANEQRLEEERIAKENEAKRLEEERIANEQRLEEERIAKENEAKRLEEERIANEQRLEEERIAKENEMKELKEEQKVEAAKFNYLLNDSNSDNMETKLLDYSQTVLKKIVETASSSRANYIPKVYRAILKENIYHDLFLKKNNLLYGFQDKDVKWTYDQLTTWFNDLDVISSLGNVNELLKTFYNNYQNNIRNTSMSYENKSECINKKADAISNYINTLNNYFEVVKNENNDTSLKLLNSMVNLITTAKTFYNARRIVDDTSLGKLMLMASACRTIEVINDFLNYQDKQKDIMHEILSLHNGFKNIYLNTNVHVLNKLYTTTKDDFEKELLSIRDDKLYFLNLVYMTYNQMKYHYLATISNDALSVLKNQDLVPEKLLYSDALLKMANYFNDKRVDTMKEAINLYFSEEKEIEQYNKIMKQMNEKVASLTYELNETKANFNKKALEMEEEYENLREKHNELVKEHNSLVNDHNSLVNDHNSLIDDHNSLVRKHNETIEIAREIRDELNKY